MRVAAYRTIRINPLEDYLLMLHGANSCSPERRLAALSNSQARSRAATAVDANLTVQKSEYHPI